MHRLDHTSYSRPVIFFANGIGDAILSLPALRAITQLLEGQAFLVTQRDLYDLFFKELPLRGVLEVAMSRDSGIRQFNATNTAREVGSCDLFLAPVPWMSDSLAELIALLRPQHSVGFFPNYNTELRLDYGKHSSELAFDFARLLRPRLSFENFSQPPILPQRALKTADKIVATIPPEMRILAVHNETLPAKQWDIQSLATVLDVFLAEHTDFLAFVMTTNENSFPSCQHADRIVPVYGLPCAVALAVASQVDLFLGVDSCMLHVADFYRIPSVGLFGPTNPIEFGFRLAPHWHVHVGEKMTDISAQGVLTSLHLMAAQSQPRRRSHK